MHKVAFIVMMCEDDSEKADREIERTVQNLKNLKTWKLEKTTIVTEGQS